MTYNILELSSVCSGHYAELKTQKYLGELKELAILTGQDYTEVLKDVMSLLGQSITKPRATPKVKTSPDAKEEVVRAAPSIAIPAHLPNTATFSPLQGATAVTQNSVDELPQIPSNPNARGKARP